MRTQENSPQCARSLYLIPLMAPPPSQCPLPIPPFTFLRHNWRSGPLRPFYSEKILARKYLSESWHDLGKKIYKYLNLGKTLPRFVGKKILPRSYKIRQDLAKTFNLGLFSPCIFPGNPYLDQATSHSSSHGVPLGISSGSLPFHSRTFLHAGKDPYGRGWGHRSSLGDNMVKVFITHTVWEI